MFFQQLLNGITMGSVYVLISIGLTMVYGILELLHFAHGVVYMAGAYTALIAISMFHVNFATAIVLAMIVSGVIGCLIEFLAYRPVRSAPKITALISGIGVAIVLENVYRIFFGAQTMAFPAIGTTAQTVALMDGVTITNYQIWIMLVALVLVIGVQFFLKYTKIGLGMRATSQDFSAASLMGINVNRVISTTFLIGSGIAGIAGTLVGLYFNAVYPAMGTLTGMKAFSIVVLGGLGSIPGTIIGGLFLGIVESMADGYIGNFIVGKDAFAFIILILVLLIRPEGIFGKRIEKV